MGFLGSILLVALLSANLVFAADRTVLDEEFVKDAASDASLYEYLHAEIGAQVVPDTPSTPGSVPINITEGEVMTEIVTEEYVKTQVNANIERVYGYLHGEQDEIELVINTEPVKANFRTAIAEELETVTMADLGFPQLSQWKTSSDAYRDGVQERRETLRTQIQENTEEDLSEEEIDAILEDRQDEFHRQLVSQFMNNVPEDELPPGGEEGVRTIATTIADGVLTDQSHGEFVSEMNAAEDAMQEALLNEAMTRVDSQVPDQVDLTEQASQGDLAPLQTAREVVDVVGLLRLVLPIVCIGLIGSIVWVAPRYSSAAFEIGSVSVLIGFSGVIVAQIVPPEVRRFVGAQDLPQGLGDFIIALMTNLSEVIVQQSGIILGIGVVVVFIGIVIRYRLVFSDFLDAKSIE